MDERTIEDAITDHAASLLLRYFSATEAARISSPTIALERDRELLRLHWALSPAVSTLVSYILAHRHQRILDRSEFERGTPHPIRKGGAVEIDALSAVDLGLPVERKVIGIFADQHMGDCGLGSGNTSSGRCWCRRPSRRTITS